jgi:regulator of protease activity HflC (stomatin/prohibitin superfamily)
MSGIILGNASIPGEMNANELSTFATLVSIIMLAIIIFLTLLRKALKVVRHSEVMIVERFGRYKTTLKPGLHFLWPIIEEPRCIKWRHLSVSRFTHAAAANVVQVDSEVVDMREHVIDFGYQVRRAEGEQRESR